MSVPNAGVIDRLDLPLSHNELRNASYRYIRQTPALPLPGRGETLERWRVLTAIANADVCLAKVLEAHYDAHAILRELGHSPGSPTELWAVWAAEPPNALVKVKHTASGPALSGTKAWCSGADLVSHALITARHGEERLLVRVDMAAEGVSAPARSWDAVGMSRVISGELQFSDAPCEIIGCAGDYLARPGFWHGGAGIAACWFGGATAIAEALRTHPRAPSDALTSANLGVIDFELAAAAALLRETATLIDREPDQPHANQVIRVRSFVERVATDVIDRVGRALGAGPLCQDRAHAQRCADLATFLRQSHADRDWQGLGKAASEQELSWRL
jgi:alkylation response protein AidB-like acyl-CoA dehydrogenase